MENFNKKVYFFNKIYYLLLKERFNKKISYNFPKNINRWDLIKRIIKEKRFNSYLEIGCDDDYSFSQIEVEKKIGPVSRSSIQEGKRITVGGKEYFVNEEGEVLDFKTLN